MNNFNDIISIFDIFNASIKISNENELSASYKFIRKFTLHG